MKLAGARILVTGADGFIGSHLCELLTERGAKVRALSQYNSFNSWGWLEEVACLKDLEVVTGDVRDAHFVKVLARDIDLIFHLAALIAIPYSYKAPDSYVQTNVSGTLNVVQAALENRVQRVVHTSTSEVYGTARRVPIDEHHPLQPQSPYSATKIAADAIALSFFHAFKLPVMVARPFNTYGPRQSARAVIPTIVSQILAGASQIRLGSLHPTRDFTFVTDTCRGLAALAECDAAIGQTVNIGSNFEISIGAIAELIQEIIGTRVAVAADSDRIRPEGSEVDRLWCDNSMLRSLTGFLPQIDMRNGLERTVEWFRKSGSLSRYKTAIYNV
jgi:NAD dependent epimerase/dehydratase